MTRTATTSLAEQRRASLDDILDALGAPALVEVLEARQELLRFGGSRITYQHAEQTVLLRARLVRDGRAAWATLGTTDLDAVRTLRQQTEDALRFLPRPPADEALLPDGAEGPVATTPSAFASTECAGPVERARLFVRARDRFPQGTSLGGSATHAVVRHAVASTAGLRRAETRTRAVLQVVASLGERSSYGRIVHRDHGALADEVDGLLERIEAGLQPLPTRHLEPGPYPTVLGPQAVDTLLATLGYGAFGARQVLGGASVFSDRQGQRVACEDLTLWDDGADPAGLPTAFDTEGSPKRRVALIDRGHVAGMVHDRASARAAGTCSTGHAVPPGWRFGAGPAPSHLVVEPGRLSDDDLLHSLGQGLFVQRVDYVRVVQPRITLVTGTTRDATLWVDGGRLAARVPQFRFTLRLDHLLASVRAVGTRRERGELVFLESIVAPALLVEAFPFGALTA
ncbi:MAG: TldD/PmbA family protein [Chloroflexi bacterium]|nr:TldD/PmbA family protein [Chloroflexota bacterium]